jgi:8-oxo-dGTP diphosphatase
VVPPVALTVEVVLLAVVERRLCALLLRAGRRFPGRRALPGGTPERDQTLDAAAHGALARLAGGLDAHLEQLRTYGDPGRYPLDRVATVAYLGLTPARAVAASPAASWVPVDQADSPAMALDHALIVADGVERARSKLEYSALAAALVAEPFRLAELRHVYEAVWGAPLDPGNFRRKVLSTPGFVEPAEELAAPGPGGGRPARLYRRGTSRLLHPAMLRPGRQPQPEGER